MHVHNNHFSLITIYVHVYFQKYVHLCSTDKTAPNVAFEYGGDGNGEEVIKEIEIEEKKHLLDSAVSATFARFCTHSECTVKFNVLSMSICSSEEREKGTLLAAGVCIRVPFSRVTIKQPPKLPEKTEEVDIAGVCVSPSTAHSL